MRARRDFVGVTDSILVAVATECVPTEIGDWTNDVLRRIAAETRVNDLKITDDALGVRPHIDTAAFYVCGVRFKRATVEEDAAGIGREEAQHAAEFAGGVIGELAVSDRAAGAPHMHRAADERGVVGESAVGDQPAATRAELNRASVARGVVCKDRVRDLTCATEGVDRTAVISVIVLKDAVVNPNG